MGGTKSNIELITQDKKEQKGYKKYEDDDFISNSQSEKPKSGRKNGNILEQQASKNPLYDKSPSDKSFNDKSLNSELSNSWLASRKRQENNRLSNSNILYEKPYQYEPPPIKPIKKPKPQSNPFPNPYGNHRPDFGMPPISKITQILKKLKPRKKPLNSFALEAIKLLGGRGQVNTPLTKQHGEKLISARHDLPMHAPLSEKQNIYDIEEKAFETMQKPNATLGDFFKNIGAIDDDDRQPKDRIKTQQARIDMAKKRRAKLNLQAKNNKDTNAEDHKEDKTQTAKYSQELTADGGLRLIEITDQFDGGTGDDKIPTAQNETSKKSNIRSIPIYGDSESSSTRVTKQDWKDWHLAMDEMKLSDVKKHVYGDIFSHEGGNQLDRTTGGNSGKSGILTSTLLAIDDKEKEKLEELGISINTKPVDLTMKQQLGVYELYFDEVFKSADKNNGLKRGSDFLDGIGNATVASAIADPIFREGQEAGTKFIQDAINRLSDASSNHKKIKADGIFGSQTYRALQEIAKDPKQTKIFLNYLADEKIAHRKKEKNSKGELVRINYYRPK